MPVKGEFDDLEEKLFGVHLFSDQKLQSQQERPLRWNLPEACTGLLDWKSFLPGFHA